MSDGQPVSEFSEFRVSCTPWFRFQTRSNRGRRGPIPTIYEKYLENAQRHVTTTTVVTITAAYTRCQKLSGLSSLMM